jgi:hypothetical protein
MPDRENVLGRIGGTVMSQITLSAGPFSYSRAATTLRTSATNLAAAGVSFRQQSGTPQLRRHLAAEPNSRPSDGPLRVKFLMDWNCGTLHDLKDTANVSLPLLTRSATEPLAAW